MPTAAHVVYIPGVLLIGIVIGFVLSARARKAAEAEESAKLAAREARKKQKQSE